MPPLASNFLYSCSRPWSLPIVVNLILTYCHWNTHSPSVSKLLPHFVESQTSMIGIPVSCVHNWPCHGRKSRGTVNEDWSEVKSSEVARIISGMLWYITAMIQILSCNCGKILIVVLINSGMENRKIMSL